MSSGTGVKTRSIQIAASVACADLAHLARSIGELEAAGVDALHFDFCDGRFAPTFLLSCLVLRSVRALTALRFDVHLYCEYPSLYLDELANSGADTVIVHLESREDYRDVTRRVRQLGMKAGCAVLPATAVPAGLEEALPGLSLVIGNTVGPAYPGQAFDVRGVRNLETLGEIVARRGYETSIGADGGVSVETLDALLCAGVDQLVCGTSSIFRPRVDLGEATRAFRAEVQSRALR